MIYFWLNRQGTPWSLNAIYRSLRFTKQGFHKILKKRSRNNEEAINIVEIIRQIRNDHPTMCCRSMYYKINPMYMGRDKFEDLCRAYGFMVKVQKSKRRTTDSSGVIRFDNLLKGFELSHFDQAWCSDITYFELDGVFYYITFILDCYSRRILGSHVSSRLLTEHTTLPAMKKAIKTRQNKIPVGIIFHSDGGGQYYDNNFLALTNQYKFKNSMCEYAYENGKAERLNGVIKNNYLRHWEIKDLGGLTKAVDRAVRLYNTDKPHSSIERNTPLEFEEKLNNLARQNKPTMTKSFEAKNQICRVSNPAKSEQNKPQIQNVFSAKNVEKNC